MIVTPHRALITSLDKHSRGKALPVLEDMDFEVKTTKNPKEALSEQPPFSLALVGLNKTNASAVRSFLKTSAAGNMNIIYLVEHRNATLVEEFLEIGRSDWLCKPLHTRALQHRVRTLKTLPPWLNPAPEPAARTLIDIDPTLARLHNLETGLLDARGIAQFLGLNLTELAEKMSLTYTAIHKNPDSKGVQEELAPIRRIVEILLGMLGSEGLVRVWLNTPQQVLSGYIPIEIIKQGNATILKNRLEGILHGLPG